MSTADSRRSAARAALADMAAEVKELTEAAAEPVTETLARWLALQYVAAARVAAAEADDAGLDLPTLRSLTADVVALRRGDHNAGRLRIEREQLDLAREQTKERLEKLFWEWSQKPENKDRICQLDMSQEERAERIRQIFGLARAPAREADGNGAAPRPSSKGLTPEGLQTVEEAFHIL